jgi:hypothetical protein
VPAVSCLALRPTVACCPGQAAPATCFACIVDALADRLASCLPVCERSTGPQLHASFAASVTVDRWLSVGPNFSTTPWHRAPYVLCALDICFIWMLHVFHLDVAYVALTIYVCCSVCFKCFMFRTYVASVLSVCFIYCNGYTRMLKVYVSNVSSVSDVCYKCFFKMCCSGYVHRLQAYVSMFHLFHTYVAACASCYKCFH